MTSAHAVAKPREVVAPKPVVGSQKPNNDQPNRCVTSAATSVTPKKAKVDEQPDIPPGVAIAAVNADDPDMLLDGYDDMMT